ncbi:hypothetical protein COL24_28980 [Bacillus toyonensis]|uniref:C39 family peptidase n=1 Tax=Bacillus toyonensis TaxID=155322 RepID=UPI000BF0DD6B|nr:C39 family peptidase [Bacillus toyonensis]PEK97749.1 hypothetical protein CN606_29840 [Bacillus toyonensis]PEO23750.1 hypothetical protein CN589_31255 [Bacillus toyonensis]PEO80651.1 hypothetical protein CN570_08410 [Bacillus toyonensis]PFX35863.1 hypothetical protein COL24_28980 [Bacillus toyonensis]PFY06367.1 hypothetical protein COL45_00305 [Bacillus toyonensis]
MQRHKNIYILIIFCIVLYIITLVHTGENNGAKNTTYGIDKLVKLDKKNSYSQENNPLEVPLILQNPELDRGCEVTSLAMLLNFNGLSVDKLELAKNIKYVPFQNNGLMGNMNEGFVGDMYDIAMPGLGVHIKPILELAKLYTSENCIIDLTGSNPENLYTAIDKEHPVWILTNASFRKLPDYEFRTWKTNTGEMQVTYRQHSVLLTGYTEQYVYINDPLDTEKNKRIDKKDFEEAWVQLGRQALTIIPSP